MNNFLSSITLQNPWGMTSLIGLLIIIIIYLFRKKYQTIIATGIFLWQQHLRTQKGGRRYEKLKVTRSLILDLLAFLCLIFALCMPSYLSVNQGTLVIVLDKSFSMQANNNYQKVISSTEGIIKQRNKDTGIVLITAGETTQVLCDTQTKKSETLQLLKKYNPYSRIDSLNKALSLSRELVSGYAEIHLFTDKTLKIKGFPNTKIAIHSFAANDNNLAIVDALRFANPNKINTDSVIITIANYSPHSALADLQIAVTEDPKEILFQKTNNISANGKKVFELEIPNIAGRNIAVEITNKDTLPADSKVILVPEPELPIRYYVSADKELKKSFEIGLQATGANKALDLLDANLIITDKQQKLDDVFTVKLSKNKTTPKITTGPYVISLANPLCKDISLTGAYWGFYEGLNLPPNAIPLIIVGDNPLFWQESKLLVGLNLTTKTNLPLLSVWPALMTNITKSCRKQLHGIHKENYLIGEELQFNQTKNQIIKLLNTKTKQVINKTATAPTIPGIYQIQQSENTIAEIAVNPIFPAESNLEKLAKENTDKVVFSKRGKVLPKSISTVVIPLLLLALALLLLNWWLDGRSK